MDCKLCTATYKSTCNFNIKSMGSVLQRIRFIELSIKTIGTAAYKSTSNFKIMSAGSDHFTKDQIYSTHNKCYAHRLQLICDVFKRHMIYNQALHSKCIINNIAYNIYI